MIWRKGPAPRDQEPSPFSEILRGFWQAHPSVLAAAFVDGEGECIDYFSSLDPYDTKVAGAHLVASAAILRENFERANMGEPRLWIIEAERRDLVMARASDDYVVVLVLTARGLTARMLQSVESLIEALAREAGFELEWGNRVHVDVGRDADGGPLPLAVRGTEETLPVLQILARWSERGAVSEREMACYRVVLPDGELTLVHDTSLNSWRVRSTARDSQRPRRPSRAE